MSDERIDRKIAVIFATDVVGYSKSMEVDEAQTIKNLRACRTLLNKSLTKYDGRIFNTAGDSILADFSSAVEALECAAEFQANLQKRNKSSEAAKQMEFRIGINMGDVVKEDGNLYGDGVNIAARLEALAQPNGISISKPVYDFVQGKTDLVFNDLGIQRVKRNSFHVYDVVLDGLEKRHLQKPLFSRQPVVAAIISLLAICIGAFWLTQKNAEKNSTEASDFAFELPSKPSIAVMPFANLSSDETKEYIGSGLTQNITNALSRSSELFVISNSSAKQIFLQTTNARDISIALGVQFLLTGSVQNVGEQLRVNVELVDALSGDNIWVDQFNGNLSELFDFQDDITNSVFEALQIKFAAEWGGAAVDPARYSSVSEMRAVNEGRRELLKFTPEAHKKFEDILMKEYNAGSRSGPLINALGWLYFQKVAMGLFEDRADTMAKGREAARQAHEIMGDANSLVLGAWFDLFDRDYKVAQEKVRIASKIGSPSGDNLAVAGSVYLLSGQPESARKSFVDAMRVSPFHPPWYANRLVTSLVLLERYEEATEVAKSIVEKGDQGKITPYAHARALVSLAIIAKRQSDDNAGRKAVERLIKVNPNFTQKTLGMYIGQMKDTTIIEDFRTILGEYGLPAG
ncbi:MAG: adenylate/guanylate cyclase domain-containing protein [Paracoccaceae bacterium]